MKRLALLLLLSCGYRSANTPSSERIHVALASSKVADAVAADEVLSGVRESLASAGALASGDGYPRCEVEVLRADESSEGIAARANADGRLVPESRATRKGIVARAWLVHDAAGARARDTGDVRAVDVVAVASNARAGAFREDDSLRAAARQVGQRLGRKILGLPAGEGE